MTGIDREMDLGVVSGRADGDEWVSGNKERRPRDLGVDSVDSVMDEGWSPKLCGPQERPVQVV
jgi:hypothetical protein